MRVSLSQTDSTAMDSTYGRTVPTTEAASAVTSKESITIDF